MKNRKDFQRIHNENRTARCIGNAVVIVAILAFGWVWLHGEPDQFERELMELHGITQKTPDH